MFTIQRPGEDPHERLAGREPGRSVKDPAPTLCFVYVKLLSDDARSYLELADEYDAKTFVKSVCRFALGISGEG